jgi:hypothetical protein
VTVFAEVMGTVHGPLPEQAPLQPANAHPAAGVAVSVTMVSLVNEAWQVVPQSMPVGTEVTVPLPVPARLTLSEKGATIVVVARRRFGEPAPILVNTFAVVLRVSSSATCAGVHVGLSCRRRAATPVTWGAAWEVPVTMLVAVSLVIHAEVMFSPGAKTSCVPYPYACSCVCDDILTMLTG